jgi:hypothetical protein
MAFYNFFSLNCLWKWCLAPMLVGNMFLSAMLYTWLLVSSCFEFWKPVVCQEFWAVVVYQTVHHELCCDFHNEQFTHVHCQVRYYILGLWCLNVFALLRSTAYPMRCYHLHQRCCQGEPLFACIEHLSLAKHWITKHSIHRLCSAFNYYGRTV